VTEGPGGGTPSGGGRYGDPRTSYQGTWAGQAGSPVPPAQRSTTTGHRDLGTVAAPVGTDRSVRASAVAPARLRRSKLVVRRIDPWSVLKFSLVFSLCLMVVFVVAVAALYFALDSLGVFDSINGFVKDITDTGGTNSTGGLQFAFTPGAIIGGATVLGLLQVVLSTAIATLCAFLYNLVADIVGGIEITLSERD
jgi:hypothetical protein